MYGVIDALDRQATLLAERRQALITAAVTGQIDVTTARESPYESGAHTERAFEDRVEHELLRHGWETASGLFSAEMGIYTGALWEFVGGRRSNGGISSLSFTAGIRTPRCGSLRLRVAAEIDSRGVLDVLRQGVKDRGVQIELAYFRPGHTLAEGALDEYNANILTVARQLHFSFRDPSLSVDMAFFVNGLPVATAELKNPNTGQNADHAIDQYRGRDPNDLFFARRTLVHFAVDPDRAFITTRLRGGDTEFLPFNVGSNGAGRRAGRGTHGPFGILIILFLIFGKISGSGITGWSSSSGSSTSSRQTRRPARSTRTPRRGSSRVSISGTPCRSWSRTRGSTGRGSNYLVEHSAGSGKSNTIAWLGHRLSNLFGDDNQPVFHKVIVITDRLVLDRQLQRTIFQFDHTPGVVKKIDVDSAQLAEALEDATSKIIISTLQMYPYVLAKIADARLGGSGTR